MVHRAHVWICGAERTSVFGWEMGAQIILNFLALIKFCGADIFPKTALGLYIIYIYIHNLIPYTLFDPSSICLCTLTSAIMGWSNIVNSIIHIFIQMDLSPTDKLLLLFVTPRTCDFADAQAE